MPDDPTGVIALLHSDADITRDFFVALHRELNALGWERIRTNAIGERFTDVAHDAGFATAQRLVLLERPRLTDNRNASTMETGVESSVASSGEPTFVVHAATYHGSSPRARRMIDACARIDAVSFPPTWSLDGRALRDAAGATPRHRFFFVEHVGINTDINTETNSVTNVVVGDVPRENAMCGYLLCGADSSHGFVQRLAVHPRSRRSGVARALLARSLKWLESLGVHSTWVNTEPDNHAALRLYLTAGFRRHSSGLVVVERSVA